MTDTMANAIAILGSGATTLPIGIANAAPALLAAGYATRRIVNGRSHYALTERGRSTLNPQPSITG